MTNNTIDFMASDGVRIALHNWLPNSKPVTIIQIVHGMAEYAMRYDRFAQEAIRHGYAVYAADLRGHGETAGSIEKLGYLADKNGFERVMEDQHEITLRLHTTYPETPIILFAHSFGSFIAQLYLETYGNNISACILSGTKGPDPITVYTGKMLANLIALFAGRKKKSPMLTKLTFSGYNKHIPNAESQNSWLSRDREEVRAYDATPWAGFVCTAGFYQDLLHGLSVIHSKKMLRQIPKNIPILLLSGTEDPVSSYAATVQKLSEIYKQLGLAVQIKLYEGGRHESLNEINREEVTQDIIAWIDNGHRLLKPSQF